MEQETEEIFLLRHRFGRTIEIWTAYNVFLKRQVLVGQEYVCYHSFVVEQTTHTLLITYYSYLYSLFDPSGTNFIQATEPFIEKLPERAKIVRQEIIEHWEKIQEPINKIRHNIGFHGGKKIKNQKSGYSAYADTTLHPWSPDYILQMLRVFFRDLDNTVSFSENYLNHISQDDTDKLYELAKKMKADIDNTPIEDIFKNFIEHLNKINEMATTQTNYRLVVFKFKYVDCYCVWPLFFITDPNNKFGKHEIDFVNGAIADLSSIPGVSDIKKVHDKYADLTECVETIDYILKDDEGKLVNTDECKVKYLEIEEQKLSDTPRYDYETSSFYKPILIRDIRFPVRVRSEYFKFLLDDIQLPLLTIKS